jgi:hypothetical protein
MSGAGLGSIGVPSASPGTRTYVGGTQVGGPGSDYNFFDNDFSLNTLNNRLDVALTKILKGDQDPNDRWKYRDAAQTGSGGVAELIGYDGSGVMIGQASQTVPRPVKVNPGLTSAALEVGTDGKTRLGGTNRRIQFDETGLTAARNVTFNDAAGKLYPATNVVWSETGLTAPRTYTLPNFNDRLVGSTELGAGGGLDWTQYQYAWHEITKGDSGGGLWGNILWSEFTGGSFSYIHSTGNYSRAKWISAATDNARAGWTTEFDFTRPDCNPRLDFKMQGTVTNMEKFYGFAGGTNATLPDIGGWHSTQNVVGIWANSADTNVRCIRGNGSASASNDLTPTLTIAASGGAHTYSVYTEDDGVSWKVICDGNTPQSFTTNLPATNSTLGVVFGTQVRTSGAANFEMRYCQFKHEMR